MPFLWEGIKEAFRLIISLDQEIWEVILFTLKVSFWGSLISSFMGVPLGFIIALKEFRGKALLNTLLNTLMALPTVVVGLTVYFLISRQGPLGNLGLLFTPTAIIIGQCILATPLITAFSLAAISSVDKRVRITALTLGANSWQAALATMKEGRFALMAAIIAGFGRVIAEVGAAMMLGGNIRGYTRTLTTTIALETTKGEFGFALALGFILLFLAFSLNILFHFLQRQKS